MDDQPSDQTDETSSDSEFSDSDQPQNQQLEM